MDDSQILRVFLVNDQGRLSLNSDGRDRRGYSPRDAPGWRGGPGGCTEWTDFGAREKKF